MFRIFLLSIMFAGIASAQVPGRPGPDPGPGPGAPPRGQGPAADRGRMMQNAAPVPEFAALKPVPHGEIRIVWYDSKSLGAQRRMHIYTPPGYDRGSARYPVLYLIHGGGQDDATWYADGRAGFILDNLLAAGKIKPMIVVMPNGSTKANQGPPGNDNSPDALAARANSARSDLHAFLGDLVGDIVPYVDSNYRTLSNRENRAIAGLSFGGAESLWAGTTHLDKFAWIGVFSMGIQGGSDAGAGAIAGSGSDGTPDEFVKANEAFFADPSKTNELLKLFWIGVGKDDHVVVNGPKQLSDTLTAHGIHNGFHESDGGHDMTNWQAYFRDFATLLFR
jgi:enterochelin esterase-like enzyme